MEREERERERGWRERERVERGRERVERERERVELLTGPCSDDCLHKYALF